MVKWIRINIKVLTPHRCVKFFVLSYFFTVLNFTGVNLAHSQDLTFEEWKQKQKQAYQDYKTDEDKAFIKFLEKEWKAFEVFKGGTRDTVRKPPSAPIIRDALTDAPKDRKTTNVFSLRVDAPNGANSFFGHNLKLLSFPVTKLRNLTKPKKEFIAEAWSNLSSINHTEIISTLQAYQNTLDLGDWGMIKLIDYLLNQKITDANSRICYAWFLLNKLGYDIKLGYTRSALILLLPTISNTYGMEYTLIDGQKHYLHTSPESRELLSYDGHYKSNQRLLDFSLSKLIASSSLRESRELRFTLDNLEYHFKFDFDAGLREFLWSYPQLDLEGYFHTSPNNPLITSLKSQLEPKVADRNPRESINFLLRFVQALFEYKTDTEQFGREKYMVIEESLHFGINDCEDRSIFLAWLINSLLNLDVLALDYPGHVALAVRTRIKTSDEFIEFHGSKFLIVDPTYIGADAGEAMPEFKHVKPKLIPTAYQ